MGEWTGDYGTNLYPSSRRKQYVKIQMQQGKPVATPDGNDDINLGYENLRNFIEKCIGSDLFIDDAYGVVANSSNNDFNVTAGSAWVKGIEAYLALPARYINDGSTYEEKNLCSVSTGLAAEVLTDSAMNWAVNELAGRQVIPDITDGSTFTIVSNTATTLTVTGGSDMTVPASSGDYYRLDMTTPVGSGRTDTVWLNVYLDEIDATEDPDLLHNLGSGLEVDRRVKARTILQVEQSTSVYANYTDGDSNDHYLVKIATLTRYDGQDAIDSGDVADDRSASPAGQGAGGRTVVVSDDDSTPADLESKIVAGTAITLVTLNPGANEQLQISASGAAFTDELVKISATDTTEGLLAAKIAAGTGIALSTINSPGNEQLQISATMSAVVLDGGLTDDATLPLAPLDGVTLFWEKIDISSGAAGLIIQVMGTNLTGWTQSVHQRLIFDLQNDLYIGSGQGGAILTWTAIPAWTPATTTKYLLWSDGVNRMTSMLKYVHGDGLWVGNYNVSSNRNGSYIWHTF